ncbi:hypothetical protein BASA81_016507 [Batrachochytrium salamandrivorans]|nr:hypothetical protein BASA81_016507 [Batrachochytrium salamandrivorans]
MWIWFFAALVLALAVMQAVQPKFDPKLLSNKRVIVTGASQGIGEALAYELAKMNASVVLIARSKDKLETIAAKCKQLGSPQAFAYATDLGTKNESTHKDTIDKSAELLGGGVDFLILNHLSTSGLVHQVWQNTFAMDGVVDQFYLNVFSYFTLAHHALPWLDASPQGRLVVVSSTTGVISLPKVVAYAAQKHALHGYFNSLRSNRVVYGSSRNASITLAVLGAIDTESFRTNTAGDVQIKAESPSETALAIISSGALGARTLYFPSYSIRSAHILYTLFPEVMDWVGRQAT